MIKTVYPSFYFKLFLLALTIVSCRQGDRKFDNPVDPEAQKSVILTEKAGVDKASEEKGAPGQKKGAGTDSICLLNTCTPPEGSIFDFANAFSITPSGCSGVGSLRMYDTGSGLLYFFMANCGLRKSLYSMKTAYSGAAPTTPISLSVDCNTGTTGVTSFSMDKGVSGYLIAYVCSTGTSSAPSFTTRMVPIDYNGNPGSATLYETLTYTGDTYDSSSSFNQDPIYRVSWNPAAGAFGIGRPLVRIRATSNSSYTSVWSGKFQRFTDTGVPLGASIAVSNAAPLTLFSGNGYWYSINGGTTASCSKVNASGGLECNGVSLTGTAVIDRVFSPSAITVLNRSATGNTRTYSTIGVNPNTCSVTPDSSVNFNFPDVSALGHLYIGSNFIGVAGVDGERLSLTVMSSNGANRYQKNAVADYKSSVGSVDLQIIENKIYIAYDKDGGGFVSYSSQSVIP